MTDADRETDAAPRPWERPGAVRRDYESHRGTRLAWLGTLGLVGAFVPGLGLAVAPLSALVWVLARRDLTEMQAGRTDPAGLRQVTEAREYALAGLAVTAVQATVTLLGLGGLWALR
jgi:hypothetical protein